MQTTITEEKSVSKEDVIPPPEGQEEAKTTILKINSRFGEIYVDVAHKIDFKHGLLGIPNAVSFCITELPDIQTDQFRLLQCLEDDELSFIVVPSQYDNQLLEQKDLDDACLVLDIKPKDLLVLFIVTVHEEGKERRISVNAKAPVLVNLQSKTATQYVFQNSSYEIQHMIS